MELCDLSAMDRNRDLRRAAISTVNNLPRRRQKVTTLRDSTDDDRQMELQETVRLIDREQLQKKNRDRDFPKRRRVDNSSAVQQRSGGGGSYRVNVSMDSSDEEYLEEEEETRIHQQNRMNQLSPTSSSLTNNRRGLRSLRSSPVLRTAVDEVLGVPIPRRARSASAKKLHEYRNSGNGGFGEDLSHRKFSPSPATVSPNGSVGASPSSSGASMKKKKKMKYVEPETRVLSSASNSKPSSMIQDDIEIEVAEALFDLMKQSHSQSQTSEREEKVDRDRTNTDVDDLKRLKAERGKDDNYAFKFQNETSLKVCAETILADSMKELNKGGRIEKEKFPDDPVQESVSGDGFVDKGKVGSPKGSESLSCVKVNAWDIQVPTVTKADYAASVVGAEEARIEIDLMALPSLPSSPERDASFDINPKVTTQDVQKKSETSPNDGIRKPEEKNGIIRNNQLLNLNLEKHRYDISSVVESTTQQPSGRKEPKNQFPTSLLSFPIGMGSWHGLVPHTGYMPSHRAVLPTEGSVRFSMTMQPPQFKFSLPRRKRCATHQYIAYNIHNHQQLIEKSLSSGPAGAATLYGTKPLNFKSMLPTQRLLGDFQGGRNSANIPGGSGEDKHYDVAADFNVTTSGSRSALQQASNQAPAHNFLHNPGFTFPLGHHHQATTMAPANSSGPPQSSSAMSNNVSLPSNNNLSRKLSSNLPLPEASTTAATFNHSIFPSYEATASYMAILQNSGCPFPIPTNISLPSFKGGLNSSFYSPPVFNIAQNQHLLSLPSQKRQPSTGTKISDNKSGASVGGDGSESHSVKPNGNVQTYSFPVQPMKNFGAVGNTNNKHGDIPQPFGPNASSLSKAQNSPIFQMLPEMPWNGNKNLPTSEEKSQTRGGQSLSLAMAHSKFDSLSQSSLNSVAIPNFYHHQHQMQQLKASTLQTDYSSFHHKWDNNFPITTTAPQGSSQSLVNIPQLKNSQAQYKNNNNKPASIQIQGHHHVGSSSNSCISKNRSSGQINASIVVGNGASTVSVLASQETEGSPACRRNVPSILSTCASQLSELKY